MTTLLPTIALLLFATTITVDVAANRHAINPEIYGVAFASEAQLRELNAPLNRSGGNNTSRYNWQANAYNHDFDFYWESIAEESALAGDDVDRFIRATQNAGARPMITIPLLEWAAKLGPNRGKLASFSIAKYGPQQDADFSYFPDAGNGIRPDGTPITGNDPNDANVRVDVAFQRAWVQHIVGMWGAAPRYYVMDNEPSLWHETHRDVHPQGQTLEELRDKIISYARMVKAADPQAQVVAPEEWGWLGYRFSGADFQYATRNNWNGIFPDRAAHGGADQIPWLLGEVRRAEAGLGVRLIDVCTAHMYPQGGEFSDDVSSTMQRRRNRSTRSLWDRAYRDETWIDDNIYLIPRLKEWVAAQAPGIRTGITEYNWGAENHINGATTQADILGIFGREGLDLAARWTTPASSTPTFKAMKMYRNYDGTGSGFGDVSVMTSVPDPDSLSAFGAQRSSDGAVTIMLVNKESAVASPEISIASYNRAGIVERWQLTAANRIERVADVAVSGQRIELTLPAQSITLLVIKPASVRRRGAHH